MHSLALESDDLVTLYAAQAGRLERIVRVSVRASDAVIEDACQIAWIGLVVHRRRVQRGAAMAWLVKTAMREAIRLDRRESRELSLEAMLEGTGEAGHPAAIGPGDPHDDLERLASLRSLPERQQRFLWMQGLGLSYKEMADRERCTLRTVQRQILRARTAARAA